MQQIYFKINVKRPNFKLRLHNFAIGTVAELIGVHSSFLKLKVVIYYTKLKDNYYCIQFIQYV